MSEQAFWVADANRSEPGHFTYTVNQLACVGPSAEHQFYMGGVAMATHIDALQRHFEKPLLWATIQFLNHGMLYDDLDLSVSQVGGGRNVLQAMAVMQRGDEVLHRTMAALGARGDTPDQVFVAMPSVAGPRDCDVKADDIMAAPDNLLGQFERRTAHEDSANGCEYMWIRARRQTTIDAAYLALVSDFFLGAHIKTRGGTSLDNTFRLINAHQTEWILAVTQLSSFTRGAAQGTQHLFAEDGTLLSTSSQTGLLPR